MAKVQVGPDHVIGGIIHTRILRDPEIGDPHRAFFAQINAPGVSETLNIADGAAKDFKLPVPLEGFPAPTIRAEVQNFSFVPPVKPTALSFELVFKIVEIFKITVGSVPVTASLEQPA